MVKMNSQYYIKSDLSEDQSICEFFFDIENSMSDQDCADFEKYQCDMDYLARDLYKLCHT